MTQSKTRHQVMMSQKLVSCSKCQYEQTLSTAKNCQFCGASLSKKEFVLTATLLGLAGLGLIGAGTFFLRGRFPSVPANQNLTNGSIEPGQSVPRTALSTQTLKTGGGELQSNAVQIYKRIADVPNVPQGIFNYGGSMTFAPLRSPQNIKLMTQAFPQFQLRYTDPIIDQPGSGIGIQMLLQSQLSFAQSSRGLKPTELAQSKARGYALEEIPVALDGIAFYVNPELIKLGLNGLTLEQVQDIFTGKIRNWKHVGGPDLRIVPFSRALKSGGTVIFFEETILKKKAFGSNVRFVRDTTSGIRRVAINPGGISYASASDVVGQKSTRLLKISKKNSKAFVSPCGNTACTAINSKALIDGSYPITRRLMVIIKRDGQQDEQAGLAYANILLSDEGQQLISQLGLVPLH
jgi:phosphate transport system substrate-binding protein